MRKCLSCDNEAPPGKGKYCSKCSSRIYRERNPDYQKEYRDANIDVWRQYSREWCRKNPEKNTTYKKKTAIKHPDTIKKRNDRNHRSLKSRFNSSKERALKRGLTWNLSLEEYQKLINQSCYYCNNLFGPKVEVGTGLDRLDNKVGYEIANVVSSCRSCNVLRNDILTSEETKLVIDFILKLRRLNN